MTVNPEVLPGLLLLALELLTLAAVGYIVARVALRQTDDRLALAQGLIIGPALWGLSVNFILHLLPGMSGALAGWILVLGLGIGLAWRGRADLWLPVRTLAGFGVAALALFGVGLASRQLLSIPDPEIHLGLSATIRAGEYPPSLPWNPSSSVPYHYGLDMLIGLLTPPFGPDLAFVTELLGAYAWTGFALVVITVLAQQASMLTVLVLAPILLTAGAWALVHLPQPPAILQVPVPAGFPAAGLRATLAEIYWPSVPTWTSEADASPPNIWKPLFVLAYALAVVALERIASGQGRSWPATLTLAALLGFLGLVNEPVALMTLALWALMGVYHLRHAHPWPLIGRTAAGPVLAALLLATGGGAITDALVGSSASGLSLGWIEDPGRRHPLGGLEVRPGGIGLLSLGVVPVTTAAVLLARRHRLALSLAAGSVAFLLAALTLQYDLNPHNITRFDGHARNFALLALLIALTSRLPVLRPRWRFITSALIFALITWPTVIAPVHNIGLALSRGPQFTNARLRLSGMPPEFLGRYTIKRPIPKAIVDHIRTYTAVDARILSPHPHDMSATTGRPNASGFVGYVHLHPLAGPSFEDAQRYLDPSAVRRLGVAYVHTTDSWISSLPARARQWLDDPRLFELLIRDGADALYRIQSAFLNLEATPMPDSFEALRQAVPASAVVYLAPAVEPLDSIRGASVLSHTQLLGTVHPAKPYLFTHIPITPLDGHIPDVVVAPLHLAPSAFGPNARQPIWWNATMAVYAPNDAVDPLMPPLPHSFDVQIAAVSEDDGRITFTAVFTDRAPERWTGQDWLVAATDASPWAIPREVQSDAITHQGTAWFAGQATPGLGTLTHVFEFDARATRLAVRNANGDFTIVASSGSELNPGIWTLAVRLRQDWQEVAFIPVMKIIVSGTEEIEYQVYEGMLGASVRL